MCCKIEVNPQDDQFKKLKPCYSFSELHGKSANSNNIVHIHRYHLWVILSAHMVLHAHTHTAEELLFLVCFDGKWDFPRCSWTKVSKNVAQTRHDEQWTHNVRCIAQMRWVQPWKQNQERRRIRKKETTNTTTSHRKYIKISIKLLETMIPAGSFLLVVLLRLLFSLVLHFSCNIIRTQHCAEQ